MTESISCLVLIWGGRMGSRYASLVVILGLVGCQSATKTPSSQPESDGTSVEKSIPNANSQIKANEKSDDDEVYLSCDYGNANIIDYKLSFIDNSGELSIFDIKSNKYISSVFLSSRPEGLGPNYLRWAGPGQSLDTNILLSRDNNFIYINLGKIPYSDEFAVFYINRGTGTMTYSVSSEAGDGVSFIGKHPTLSAKCEVSQNQISGNKF